MVTRTCRDCGKDKPLSGFYRARRTCTECRAAYIRDWRARHPEKCKAWSREQRVKNRQKKKARERLRYAIRKGWVKKKPCEVCMDPKSQGHHTDYAKPLEVRWLCRTHHEREHHPNPPTLIDSNSSTTPAPSPTTTRGGPEISSTPSNSRA
jgi:hypothetical protein